MTEQRRVGRHSVTAPVAAPAAARAPERAEPDGVWVPPPFEPARPGDFVEYRSSTGDLHRSRRGRTLLLCVVLLAAFGGGWWYLRHRSSAPQSLTCSAVYDAMPAPLRHYLRISEGGAVPNGIPVPLGEPVRRCTAGNSTGSAVLAVWPGASESGYAALLAAGGWGSARTVGDYTLYVNGGDPREVVTTLVDGQLVALYDH